ncbi:DNA primase [Rickettsia typhi]|uniref:DNA primase n=2 Tax=Rickettsia typhi TaxID=785 RepID=DNAG_RICTY|nr:DNA primase [Rickettsia typhi]Q68VQ4.1 RecName: Full=DNA primase [Rickettsia typhi str. Wilmington]AAU04302.1 DNA primase [Rickettsia typhi str. Wilmington]AFE54679.1 DNA primase [Rickettsia typhi str. TH1527]AFE55518.1 DNA primase [Rickettsia typhi str. B9991CWPP]
MRVTQEFYELLRNRINISDVVRQKLALTRKSSNYVGLCPFHQEKTPSFTVSDSKRFFYCFGCKASGDVIKFTSNISGLSYNESAIKLANDYGIEIPKLTVKQKEFYEESDNILNILELANKFFRTQLTPEILNYLNQRNITETTIKEFSIGFSPRNNKFAKFFLDKKIDITTLGQAGLIGKRKNGEIYNLFSNRITIPIRNIYNKIVGFGARVLGNGLPKYLNSYETIVFQKNDTLYGEHKAISSSYKKNRSILVEGYFDVIALHQAGFSEVVASLGTSVTENHLHKLWRACDEIILCLDGDNAGIKASIRTINLALPLVNSEKKISFIRLPSGLDPDDVVNKNGADFFAKLIDKRISLSEMIWYIEYSGKNFKTAEEKANLEKNLKDYCNKISDSNLKASYYRFFKDQIWQNLVIKQKKIITQNFNSSLIASSHCYSELEMLEHAFCALLIKFPIMLAEKDIRDFILNLNFNNKSLEEFRNWYLNEIIDNKVEESEITAIVEKTSFFDIFLLLSKADNLFLDISFNKNNIRLDLLWQWLYKKYYLINLQQEYAISINGNHDFEKVLLYKKEILKIVNELQVLNESFINQTIT